jgi:hypothetical protein
MLWQAAKSTTQQESGKVQRDNKELKYRVVQYSGSILLRSDISITLFFLFVLLQQGLWDCLEVAGITHFGES